MVLQVWQWYYTVSAILNAKHATSYIVLNMYIVLNIIRVT